MKIALAQMKISEDIDENLKKTINSIRVASENKVDLILFPEIHLTPFFPQYENIDVENYLITQDSHYIKRIQEACFKYDIFAAPNLYVLKNNNSYDMSFLIDNHGNIIGKQKMVHIKQAEKFFEESYYDPSDEGFNVFETKFGKIGIAICFDRHFPESIRTLTLKGAQLILIPAANTANEPEELFKWEIKVQSFQNNVIIAMCNRVGIEDEMEFNGQSIVCDVNGDTLAVASDDEEILYANVDLDKSNNKNYIPFIRKEMYG